MAKDLKEVVNCEHPKKNIFQIGFRKGEEITFSDGCKTKTKNYKHIDSPGIDKTKIKK